ncbi:High affinity immunoglobulin epsilon receptor subunit beta [Apodemus speciosus]
MSTSSPEATKAFIMPDLDRGPPQVSDSREELASPIRLRCVNHWFYLRIKATLFANIFMEPNEVFLGIGCPVTTVWPNDVYDFTYRTYDCGIVNKVLYSVTLLQTKLTYISKNASLQAEMHLSCVLNTLNPLFCDAESRGDFTGNPPEWEVDMRVRRNEQAVLTVPPAVPAVPPAFQMVPPAVPAVPPAFQMVLQAVPVLMVPPAVPMVPPAVPTVPPAVPTVPPAVPTVPPAVLTVPPAVPMVPPNMDVQCSQDWMMAIVSVVPQNRSKLHVFAGDLFLGQGCIATRIHTYQYDFIYPVFHCGIRKKVISEEIVCFETEIYFRPRIHPEFQIIPVQCSAPRADIGSHQQPQMASQEFHKTGLGISAGGASPGRHMKPEETYGSVYQPLDESHHVQRGVLQALGAVQILNGALILALGIFLVCLQHLTHHFRHFFFFTFYTGYPLWGAVFGDAMEKFISSGSLTVAAGRNPTRKLMQNSFGMNVASTTIAFVGTAFLSVHLAFNTQAFKGCQSSQLPDVCIFLGSSSNGLVSLMLILTLLQLAMTISLSAMWCLGNVCGSREAITSPSNSVESGIPPEGSDTENLNTQPQTTEDKRKEPLITISPETYLTTQLMKKWTQIIAAEQLLLSQTHKNPPDVPDIEPLEASPPAKALPEKPASPPPQQTWQTVLKKELEFLGVTQILVGLICLCFGTIVFSVLHISDFDDEVLLLYKAGYPFWGAVLFKRRSIPEIRDSLSSPPFPFGQFVLSGFLSVISERKNTLYLVRGSLGANIISSIAAGMGIAVLILNLSNSSAYMSQCKDANEDDGCFVASFITELVLMMLFLTILAFFSAVLFTVYRIGQEFESNKVPDDRLYEELNVYSPIYSELEDKVETTSPVDS